MRFVGELNRGQFVHRSVSREAVIVAVLLALLGIAIAIYLSPFLARPPISLHAYFTGMPTELCRRS
jgi:hypothetical protein